MKYLISFLSIIFVAISAGLLAQQDSGYVLFGRGYSTIEMSLSLFILLFILTYLAAYFLIRFILRTWHMPEQVKFWRAQARSKKSRKTSLQGLINLSQGEWKKAERLLIQSAKNSDMPLVNYLSAARAAQKLKAPERRDHYLSLAHKNMPEADFSVKLTQAELQFAYGQNEQALATFVHLHSLKPKHVHIMFLLSELYRKLKSWRELKELIPNLRKYHVHSEKELLKIEIETNIKLIEKTYSLNELEKLHSIWKGVSREVKKEPQLIEAYCDKLIQLEQHDLAETILRGRLRKKWELNLVKQYGLVKSNHLEKQLTFAESLSKHHDNNPVLLLTLGRLCMYSDLWGKARAYLEASIGNTELAETYKELGMLMEYLNEHTLAAEYFKKGLFLS